MRRNRRPQKKFHHALSEFEPNMNLSEPTITPVRTKENQLAPHEPSFENV